MAIKDFFELDDEEYAGRIHKHTDTQLMKQDIAKLRQIISGSFSLGSGIFTPAITGFGARRSNVACHPHYSTPNLNHEISDRTSLTKRDFFIPVTAGLVSCGVCCGVNIGVSHAVAACSKWHLRHQCSSEQPSGRPAQVMNGV